MNIQSDYSLVKSFVTKDVNLILDNNRKFLIHLIPLKEFYHNQNWISFYSLIKTPIKELRSKIGLKIETNLYELIKIILIKLGGYKQYKNVYQSILQSLEMVCGQIEFNLAENKMSAQGIEITEEIWDYIIYLIKVSNGEKVDAPRQFNSEEERLFYLAQKEYDEQISQMRSKEVGSEDAMLKILLSITYAFPNFTFDYLFEQTLAQIRWLQKYAAEAVSYEVNKQIFAAGNMKKGSKLNFFIK